MAFMRPEYTEDQKWWMVDGTNGVECFEEHAFTKEEAIVQYTGTPFEVELIGGVGVRLHAPGYLDSTEWLVFSSLEECRLHVEEMWESDPDTGDALMEVG